ncbi:MAG TPA: hypothetical protein VL547_17405 [Dinghuibacter sp.]|jgi:hypothetical protein|uniref:hypothetical protein n=1 Tax=Dinghuibacter sp. TaxID=2024697 RepID=UPI002C3ADC17|nr:hypothetical protein [Dinghuibacter sp.]HTJ13819.1 hypothetical protein [Dinghuibacter sp.]
MTKNVQEPVMVARPFSASVGENIGAELGAKMVKNYYDANPEQAYGHLIGRDILEQLLAQPGCAGLSIHPGYEEGSNVRTLVFAAVDVDGQQILKYTTVTESGNIQMNDGIVVDHIITTFNGDSATTSSWF